LRLVAVARQKLAYFGDGVGRRLRESRLAAGLSQRDLAFPGCTPAYISRIEKGERVPSLQILREFARRLGVSETYLARGVEEAAELSSFVAARAALGVGELGEARRLVELALAGAVTDRERALAGALEGELLLQEDEVAAAIASLERAVELDPALEGAEPLSRPGFHGDRFGWFPLFNLIGRLGDPSVVTRPPRTRPAGCRRGRCGGARC